MKGYWATGNLGHNIGAQGRAHAQQISELEEEIESGEAREDEK